MGEPWKQAKWKPEILKGYIQFCLSEMSKIGKTIVKESRLPACPGLDRGEGWGVCVRVAGMKEVKW